MLSHVVSDDSSLCKEVALHQRSMKPYSRSEGATLHHKVHRSLSAQDFERTDRTHQNHLSCFGARKNGRYKVEETKWDQWDHRNQNGLICPDLYNIDVPHPKPTHRNKSLGMTAGIDNARLDQDDGVMSSGHSN